MATSAAYIDLDEGSAPATPGTGKVRLYAKTDGSAYQKDDAGTETGLASASGGGYDEGTSFPVSPTTNDKYYRTDRNLLYYYDGTRWLTTTLYTLHMPQVENVSTSPSDSGFRVAWSSTYQMYLVDWKVATLNTGTNNGSNYWTVKAVTKNSANSASDVSGATINTSAHSGSTWNHTTASVNATLATTQLHLYATSTKTGAPGNIYHSAMMTYRLVG